MTRQPARLFVICAPRQKPPLPGLESRTSRATSHRPYNSATPDLGRCYHCVDRHVPRALRSRMARGDPATGSAYSPTGLLTQWAGETRAFADAKTLTKRHTSSNKCRRRGCPAGILRRPWRLPCPCARCAVTRGRRAHTPPRRPPPGRARPAGRGSPAASAGAGASERAASPRDGPRPPRTPAAQTCLRHQILAR